MSASKVYFTDMRCPVGTGLLDKLKKLIEKAGIDSIDMDSKFVAIKIHFGEPGNLSFLRPNFAKVVADKVTSLGGRPFLTDCNTLYVGRRKHALEHLAAVVPDIGMFASFDPVALDHACIDAVNAAPAISTSVLGQCAHEHNDHFTDIHPKTNWRSQIEHAQKIGIGNVDYELVTVK